MTVNTPFMAMTLAEAAAEARIGKRTMAAWVASGKLPSQKIFGLRRILHEDLRRLLAGELPTPSASESTKMPTGPLIELETLVSIAGEANIAKLIALGKLRCVVGRVLRRDVEQIFVDAARWKVER